MKREWSDLMMLFKVTTDRGDIHTCLRRESLFGEPQRPVVVHICDYLSQPLRQYIRKSIGSAPLARSQTRDNGVFACIVEGYIAKVWQPGFAGREAVDAGRSRSDVKPAVVRIVILPHGRNH